MKKLELINIDICHLSTENGFCQFLRSQSHNFVNSLLELFILFLGQGGGSLDVGEGERLFEVGTY